MPTARNYSPTEADEEQRQQEEKAYVKQSRNARLPGNSNNGTMRTVTLTLMPGDELTHHSPQM